MNEAYIAIYSATCGLEDGDNCIIRNGIIGVYSTKSEAERYARKFETEYYHMRTEALSAKTKIRDFVIKECRHFDYEEEVEEAICNYRKNLSLEENINYDLYLNLGFFDADEDYWEITTSVRTMQLNPDIYDAFRI